MSKKDQKMQRHANRPSKPKKKKTAPFSPYSQGDSQRGSYGESGRDSGANSGRSTNPRSKQKSPPNKSSHNDLWLFGKHAVLSALNNTDRTLKRLLVTKRGAEQYLNDFSHINQNTRDISPEIVLPEALEKNLPADCVHQGIALQTDALSEVDLAVSCAITGDGPHMLLLLDQVTDPHNVGAIIRSAAAFGARAIISTDRHSPPESGALAKAASGALEILPWVRVTNLSRALEELAEMGYWRLGLDGTAEISIKDTDFGQNIALVMGAEGKGLRKGTQSHCDALIKLPIKRTVESLNVSNAAAIALYEFSS